jgi:hypothetical protein
VALEALDPHGSDVGYKIRFSGTVSAGTRVRGWGEGGGSAGSAVGCPGRPGRSGLHGRQASGQCMRRKGEARDAALRCPAALAPHTPTPTPPLPSPHRYPHTTLTHPTHTPQTPPFTLPR